MKVRRVALFLVLVALATSLSAQVSVRSRALKRQSELLTSVTAVDIEQLPSRSIDEVLVEIGKKGVKNSAPGFVPRGWGCEAAGPAWRCAGPASDNVHLSFEPSGNYRFADQIELEVGYQGRSLLRQRIPVEQVQLPAIRNDLMGVLDTPSSYSPGGFFFVRPLTDEFRYGTWRANVGGQSLSATRGLGDFGFRMPVGIRAGVDLSYTYDDPWGQRLVDAPVTDFVIGDPFDEDCQPTISACPSMGAIGGTLCVCGCFPQQTSGASLLLDGKPVGMGGGSPWVTMVSLAEVQPGRHTITWAPGSGGTGSVDFDAVAVGGSIDREVIMRGGSADLKFWIDGTRSPLDMDIYSQDTNIGIQGGNVQTAVTSGGDNNDIQRKLWGNRVGDFNVGFRIDLPPCPCGYMEQMPDGDFVRHPMEFEGEGRLDWPTGGLSVPLNFGSTDFLSMTPQPPISTDPFRIKLRQLGLTANAGDFAPFTFEARYDADSYGDFSNIQVDSQGHLRSADVNVDFRTEFSVDYSKSMPLQVGMRYEFALNDWGFKGMSEGLGEVQFTQKPGTSSSVVFDKLETDSAGSLLHGWADFSLQGELKIGGD